MRSFTSSRAAVVTSVLLALALPATSLAVDSSTLKPPAAPSRIVIGFVGGFVGHDNPHHGPVILARRIQRSAPRDTYVQIFENRRRKSAYDTVIRLLDANHDGFLSPEEKTRAKIILFGHSWEPPRRCCWRAICSGREFPFP